jgi:hypothetical protein
MLDRYEEVLTKKQKTDMLKKSGCAPCTLGLIGGDSRFNNGGSGRTIAYIRGTGAHTRSNKGGGQGRARPMPAQALAQDTLSDELYPV